MKEQFKIHTLDVKNQLQNYIFLLEDTRNQQVVVIDPTEHQIVLDYCQQQQLSIQHIWITHHHADHTDGIAGLIAQFPNIQVFAPALEIDKIAQTHIALEHEQHFEFNGLDVNVILTAGHTLGHISYFIDALDVVFCGDTLFVMGCGRVFEGTHEQMYHSLNRLAALPPRTVVYCSHEYTLGNAKFALHVEPDNLAIQQRANEIEQLRSQNLPTIPSTIALELETNPFLRVFNVDEFSRLRQMKDQF